MKCLVRCLAVACVLGLARPVQAQFPGGLPGRDHLAAGIAYDQVERVVLAGDVVHYRFDLVVGPGPFDTIRIHRVVKEVEAGRPQPNMESVLLLAGAPQTFEGIFLPPAALGVPVEEGSVALFLASHGVDVWGMDYGWSLVPYPTADFAFLQGWGIDKEVRHITTALSVVRWLRVRSEQGNGPVHVLGFSYGGFLTWAVASEDTQRPGNLKNVKGIIPVDGTAFKNNSASGRATSCASAATAAAQLAAGTFVSDSSAGMLLGRLALEDPDGLSSLGLAALPPYFPAVPPGTLTNFQYPLGSNVRSLFLGGTYAASPPSVTTFYTDGSRFIDLLANMPVYMPYQWNYDSAASRCESADYPVAFDDHLGEVTVPILAIGRRQSPSTDASTRTASADVTVVTLNPAMSPALYGHADFFLANDAATMVWQTILDWIVARK